MSRSNRFVIIIILLFFIVVPSLRGKEMPGRAPIWELKGPHATIYLAGSVHLLREKDLPIPTGFDEVYELADEVIFELDIADMMNPATMQRIREAGLLPEGETIADHFDEKTVSAIHSYLKGLGVPANALDRMKPGTLYLSLTSMTATKQGAKAELGLEIQFHRKARDEEKPTRGLETIDYQMSLFHQIQTETIQRLINEMIDEKEDSPEALDRVIAAWKSGDPKQIEEIIVAELAEEEEIKNLLLVQRNKNWIPPIEKALGGQKNVMFLVGAAHLAGDDSVIELLQRKGYNPLQRSKSVIAP
ncbi:MAG: TraB/GumN family protein [Verrucomicrobiales bacterium]|nr:TraB/GumN family protein [Verrucomicrobiales bacterium]